MTSPPGLDLDALGAYLAPLVDGLAGPLSAEVIAGGRSNLTYVVHDGERRFVVRRPPLAHVLPTAHDMAREFRVLAALQHTDIPVPRVIALCEDSSVIGARFYVMDWVDGHVVRDQMPAAFPDTPTTRAAMSASLVDTLTALHAIQPGAVGLEDFGHPDGFLTRQVRRWWMQWEASKTQDLAAMAELRARLDTACPTQSAPGITHGDYRLDNLMYAPADPSRIVAVLDWEMSTVGDPLCDLGLLLVYWAENDDEPVARRLHRGAVTTAPGFYTRDHLVQRYAARSERDLSSLPWYTALGMYKLAIVLQGIHARFLMGMTVGEGFDTMGEMVPLLVDGALDALAQFTPSRGA